MTLAKAYKLVNLAIKDKKVKIHDFRNPTMPWNQGEKLSWELADGIATYLENDLEWLKAIMKQLPPQPKCKHPKELHDKCEGKIYCMGCNEDLE